MELKIDLPDKKISEEQLEKILIDFTKKMYIEGFMKNSNINIGNLKLRFIVSTGRTGTKFFAKFFNSLDKIISYHEPYPNLFGLSKDFVINRINSQEVINTFLVNRAYYLNQARRMKFNYYIESNSGGLWGIIPVLGKQLPNYKILHIIRDGREWVRSVMNRTLFRDKDPLDDIRFKANDLPNSPYFSRWEEMSRFEKACWSWVKKNKIMKRDVLQDKNCLTLKFEKLFDKNDYEKILVELLNFFEIKVTDEIIDKYRKHLESPVNENINDSFPGFEDWTQEQKRQFKNICGDLMEYYGYEMSGIEYNKPKINTQKKKNLIVTGIPKSGTTLFSYLISSLPNAICLDEIFYNINELPDKFSEIRKRLILKKPIPNSFKENGELSTNKRGEKREKKLKVIEKDFDKNAIVGSKVNVPYLFQIEKLISYGYKIIAIVRNPLYTIGSWRTWISQIGKLVPETRVTEEDMHERYKDFPFKSDIAVERQAEVWQFLASIIWDHRQHINIITYEQLTENTKETLKDICSYLNLDMPNEKFELDNMNEEERYSNLDAIEKAVKKYAPIRTVFGYD